MASPNVSFDQIGAIRTPGVYIEFNSKLAVRTLPTNRQRIRLIGQRLAAGTVAALVPTQLFSDSDAATYFGAGSQLHLMARAVMNANPYADLHAIALDDAVGSAVATATMALLGTATVAGAAILRIGARELRVAVAVGDVSGVVGAALAARVNAVTDLPVTAAFAGGTLTLTAKNKGQAGSAIPAALRFECVGISAVSTAMGGGTGDPSIATALAVLQPAGDHILVMPYTDSSNLAALRVHLQAVGNGLEMRGAVGVVGSTGSYGSTIATAAAVNDGRTVLAWLPGSGSQPAELAAAMAAVLAAEEDPARPLNNLELVGIDPPAIGSRPTKVQIEACLANGVTPITVGPGERVQIVRAITTYTVNAAGVADVAWLDVTTIRTLDYVRTAVRTRLALRFPREKASQRVLRAVRSEVIEVLMQLEELEIVEAVRANLARVVVEKDSQDASRANIRIPCDVVNGLHVIAAVVDLYL